jgi:hypothetical protein
MAERVNGILLDTSVVVAPKAAERVRKNIDGLVRVQPFHVAAFIKEHKLSPPTVKLVAGHDIDVNPAHTVRGPKYVVKKGKTPVFTADEARTLLDSIPIVKPAAEADSPDVIGLRDRALIGLMAYSFARIGTVTRMKVGDYFGLEFTREGQPS